ncbi:MAG TPA: ferritin-like domain-containing protein, partial [Thermodesulfovibrionales bacterium]|nr:ferritin-like domain-containing protein [Thermodesulfovibrionales bacterium]
MASKKLLEMLNDAIAREIQVSVQYMWQHVMVKGINSESVGSIFKSIGIAEMKHAEAIAERLDYLGGVPTTKPTPIAIGKTANEMLRINKKAEEGAMKLYRGIIALAAKEGDVVTRKL